MNWQDVACFGDDYNDISMLSMCGHPFTIDSAKDAVKNEVSKRNGYISEKQNHSGTEGVLKEILSVININNPDSIADKLMNFFLKKQDSRKSLRD